MSGLVIFRNLSDAIRAGYQVCDCSPEGYVVRTWTDRGWTLGIVAL
jgi:hypothetical protein